MQKKLNLICAGLLMSSAAFAACPTQAPYACWDQTCRVSAQECPQQPSNANGCPNSAPILCNNGSCVQSSNACVTTNTCPNSAPVLCPNSACVANGAPCPGTTVQRGVRRPGRGRPGPA